MISDCSNALDAVLPGYDTQTPHVVQGFCHVQAMGYKQWICASTDAQQTMTCCLSQEPIVHYKESAVNNEISHHVSMLHAIC